MLISAALTRLAGEVIKLNKDGTVDVLYEDGECIQHENDPSMRKQSKRRPKAQISASPSSSGLSAWALRQSRIATAPGVSRRPRGRNPKGVKWDYKIGQWVKVSEKTKVEMHKVFALPITPLQ